jgi:hypothetical protein
VTLAITLALAFQVAGPVKPAGPLDPKEARSVAEHAIYATRTQERYETTFKVHATLAEGELDYEGKNLVVGPGILREQYSGSGDRDVRAIRVGESVWAYDRTLRDWVNTKESNESSFARGFENPEEVLLLLSRNLQGATFGAGGAPELSLTGKTLGSLLKANPAFGSVDPDQSHLEVRLEIDTAGRLQALHMTGKFLATVDGKTVKTKYSAEVHVTAYNGKGPLQFLDEKGMPMPFSAEITEALKATGH